MRPKEKKSILLVEDEAIIALASAKKIAGFGYEVLTAGSGEQAVDLALSGRGIDLVLMDIDLGRGMDGPEAAVRILASMPLPIVFLTSHSERETVERVKGITRYGYVIKNSGDFVLLSSIEMAFELFDAHSRLFESEERYRSLFENAPLGMFQSTAAGQLLGVNAEYARMLGYASPEEAMETINRGTVAGALYFEPEKRLDFLSRVRAEKGLWFRSEDRYRRKDGSVLMANLALRTLPRDPDVFEGFIEDVTEHRMAEEALRESEAKYRAAFFTSPDSININALDGRFVDINEGFTRMTGYTREDVIGVRSSEIGVWAIPEDRERLLNGLKETGSVENLESVFRRKDGALKKGLMSARVLMIGNEPHTLSITRDISDWAIAQEKIGNLLGDKELLLKEVHHRIKNNLHSVAGLLSLQADSEADPGVVAALGEAAGRVRSMRLIYDKLYRAEDFRRVSSREYLGELIADIRQALSGEADIRCEERVEDVLLDADQLMPLGIIVNELITNAYKYAFPAGRPGNIAFSFARIGGGDFELTVADDGVGIPGGLVQGESTGGSTGFGLRLVSALTAQLGGRMERGGPGTRISIRFPAPS